MEKLKKKATSISPECGHSLQGALLCQHRTITIMTQTGLVGDVVVLWDDPDLDRALPRCFMYSRPAGFKPS
jgi:hypothetical protein